MLGDFREEKDSIFYNSVDYSHPSHIIRGSVQEGLPSTGVAIHQELQGGAMVKGIRGAEKDP